MRLSRIYYLSFILMGSLILASCDDDDKVEETGLKVLSAETSFDANGGEHEVTVSKDIMKAYSAAEWLSVDTKGNTVALTAGQNTSNESRHTTLVLKASETDSTIVNVSQLGSVCVLDGANSGIAAFTDAATSFSYYMKHDLPVEVSSSDSWITVNATKDSLKVGLAENTSGHFRRGWVAYSCGNVKDTISVSQYEFAKDIAGEYYFYGYNYSTQKPVAYDATLEGTPDNCVLKFPKWGLSLPVVFDKNKLSLAINNVQYMGTYQSPVSSKDQTIVTRYVWCQMWDQVNNVRSFKKEAGLKGYFKYYDDNGVTDLAFEDNGQWDTGEVTTIRFQFFTSDTTPETKTMVRSGYAMVTAVLYPGLQSK